MMSITTSWGMACNECGWKIYRSELSPETTLDQKLLVHQTMGCMGGAIPEWRFGQVETPTAILVAA